MNSLKSGFKLTAIATTTVLAMGAASVQAAVVDAADVVVIVDESGSMGGEHAWLPGMIADLETGLLAAGVGTGADANQYALVGFGGHAPGDVPHKHLVGGGDWGSSAQFGVAAGGLLTSGGFEDGWNGIDYFFDNYTARGGNIALNVILVTDEDRDNQNAALSYANVLAQLTGAGALLNAVVNCNFGPGGDVLGVDSSGDAYKADGSGGFTTVGGGSQTGGCAGTTKADYVDMAWASGGASWDLNKLRAGGLTAESFSSAFVDIKVKEITTPPTGIPEPATGVLFGLGLASLLGLRRKLS